MNRLSRVHRTYALVLIISALLSAQCGDKIIVLGQVGVTLADSIGQMQVLTKQLVDAKVLPPQNALPVQEQLLKLNEALKPVPQILRDLDAMREANKVDLSVVDKAITALQFVAKQLPSILKGVPVADTTGKLIALLQEAQKTTDIILTELAKLKGTQ